MPSSSPTHNDLVESVAIRVTHDDARRTVYQVLVAGTADSDPLAACVVTCSHEPGGDVWAGACTQWRNWGRCPHVLLAQQWHRSGRPVEPGLPSTLEQLHEQRLRIKQLLPKSLRPPGPRKWRPTIVKVIDRAAVGRSWTAETSVEEDRTAPDRLLRNIPHVKPPGHQQWREFNQETATKYKIEMPGHECPHGWHAGHDGKCYPKDQARIDREQKHAGQPGAHPHDLALAQLAGGEIEKSTPLDPSQSGINTTHVVQIKGDGTGLYKSQAGAAAFQHPDDVKNVRAATPALRYYLEQRVANQHRHEALFYDLERRYFGTKLTPPTTLRQDSTGHEGSMQQFVPDATTASAMPPGQLQHLVETDPCLKHSLEDLTALDIFGGHQDRRAPNVLIRHDPQRNCHEAVAIDNGFSSGAPTLGGHHHLGYNLGINHLQPRHLAAAQRVIDGGLAPLINRARAVGLHANVGKQHYLNALFMTQSLKTDQFKRDELTDSYLKFLDHTSTDHTQSHEVRAAAAEALDGGLLPFDSKRRDQVVQQWELAAKKDRATRRPEQASPPSSTETDSEKSKRIEREWREERRRSTPPTEKRHGPETSAPTRLVTPASVVTAAPAAPSKSAPKTIVVAMFQVGSRTPLARFTLDEQGRLTVDNRNFLDELHQTPYHYSGAGKLLAIVQRNAHTSYQYVTFTSGTLEQLHDLVPVAERQVALAPALHAAQDFEAARQAYVRRKRSN